MEIDRRDMFLSERPVVACSYADGAVTPFDGYRLPSRLREKPLVRAEVGSFTTYESGMRSALLKDHKRWLKLKGCNPLLSFKHGPRWPSGEPTGGMSHDKALNELRTSGCVDDLLHEFGYEGVTKPAALMEYDMSFDDGKPVSAAVLETLGDTRMSSITARLMKDSREGVRLDRALRAELLTQAAIWLGFTHHVLAKAQAFMTPISYGLGNYVLYRQDDGFAAGRVDFGSAKAESVDGRRAEEGVLGELKAVHAPFIALPAAKELGIPFERLARGFELRHLDIRQGDERRLVDNDEQPEIEVRQEDGVISAGPVRSEAPLTLFVRPEDFAELAPLDQAYRDGLEGDVVPRPMDQRLVRRVFATVKI